MYIKTAQAFLQLSKLAATEREKTRCKAAGNRALERAEAIKKAKKSVLKPTQLDPFSAGELEGIRALSDSELLPLDEQHYILEKSSHINSLRFPLWRNPSQSDWEGKTFRSVATHRQGLICFLIISALLETPMVLCLWRRL